MEWESASIGQGEEYEILDDSQEHWWQVRNKHGWVGWNGLDLLVWALMISDACLCLIVPVDTFQAIMWKRRSCLDFKSMIGMLGTCPDKEQRVSFDTMTKRVVSLFATPQPRDSTLCPSTLKCKLTQPFHMVHNCSTSHIPCSRPHPQVKHYHIKQNARNEFYLSEKHCCPTIPELINYHRHNSGGLASRLKNPPSAERCAPTTAGLSHGE